MQKAYKQELQEAYGIKFNSLFCINNMPVKRYADYLARNDQLESYMKVQHQHAVSPIFHRTIQAEL